MRTYSWLRLVVSGACLGLSLAGATAPRATCLVQIPDPDSPLKDVAVERIQAYFSGPVDVWHGPTSPASAQPAALTVLLGEPGSDPRLSRLWINAVPGDSDAYRIKTLAPGVIGVSGRGPRGTLYAAYRLAELLETRSDLSALDLHREPTVARRYAMIGASSFGGAYERNLLYLKEIKELPRYGFNGVSILGYDDGNTPFGRTGPPFLVRGSSIIPIPSQITEWRLLLHEIKRYGLDVALILPPLFPGEYQAGNNLMVHGAIRAEAWRRPGLRTAWFGKPGSPVVAPSTDGYPNSSDSMAAQMNARAVPIAEFRAREQRALAAAIAGSQAVAAAKAHLSADDYAYLQAVFRDSQTVLQAVALIGEAAHAANVAADPSAQNPAAAGLFQRALSNLRAYAAQPAVRAYRASAPEQSERSNSGLVINPPLDRTLESIAADFEASVSGSHPRPAQPVGIRPK